MFVRFNMIPCILGGLLLLNGMVDALGRPGERNNALAKLAREKFHGGASPGVELAAPAAFGSPSNTTNQTLTMHWAELPIDHFASCSDTYKNRYWTQEKYYKPGGPVIVLDGGEGNAADYLGYLDQNSYFTRLLAEFGGIGLLWEHRYYGNSIPQPQGDRTWLTIDQALADIPTMAATFSLPRLSNVDLTPASTPWIFTGGSYPGVRAAMSRERYPNIFHISWAASAPVQAHIDMSSYYQPIIPGMQAHNLTGCLADIQAGTERIDELLSSNITAGPLKNKFYRDGATMTNGDFAYYLTNILGDWQNYLVEGGLDTFCEILETNPTTNATAPESGWAPTKGADWVVNRMAMASRSSSKRSLERRSKSYDDDSWMWQWCTQFGFMQAYGPELDHLISRYNSIAYQERQCKQTFLSANLSWPTAKSVNSEYGGWRMRPSNTFWTGGEFDPWRTLEPLSDLPNAPPTKITSEIPACGVETAENEIFGQVLPDSGHLFEFNDDKKARAVQATFAKAIRTWLPCFQKKSTAEICPEIPPKCDCDENGQKLGGASSKVPMSNA